MIKLLTVLFALALLGGCASSDKRDEQVMYDLGLAPAITNASGRALPAVIIPEISAPAWMENTRMVYRLHYDNPLQARTYAQARWTMSPSRLLSQRLKAGIAHSGTAVLSGSDGAVGLPQLRIEADDFSQVFDKASQNHARVSLRATLLQDRKLLGQKTFSASVPATSADAAGGVRALAAASDAVIADLVAWLNTINLPR